MTSPYPLNPSWPSGYASCRIVAHYVGSDGQNIEGSVTFTPSVPVVGYTPLSSDGITRTIIQRSREVTLSANGTLDLTLPATNAPNIVPTNWTWTVQENFDGGETYSILAPLGGTVDLLTVRRMKAGTGNFPVTINVSNQVYDGGQL